MLLKLLVTVQVDDLIDSMIKYTSSTFIIDRYNIYFVTGVFSKEDFTIRREAGHFSL